MWVGDYLAYYLEKWVTVNKETYRDLITKWQVCFWYFPPIPPTVSEQLIPSKQMTREIKVQKDLYLAIKVYSKPDGRMAKQVIASPIIYASIKGNDPIL